MLAGPPLVVVYELNPFIVVPVVVPMAAPLTVNPLGATPPLVSVPIVAPVESLITMPLKNEPKPVPLTVNACPPA